MKTKVRAVSVEIDGQNYMAIEFPIEVIEELKHPRSHHLPV